MKSLFYFLSLLSLLFGACCLAGAAYALYASFLDESLRNTGPRFRQSREAMLSFWVLGNFALLFSCSVVVMVVLVWSSRSGGTNSSEVPRGNAPTLRISSSFGLPYFATVAIVFAVYQIGFLMAATVSWNRFVHNKMTFGLALAGECALVWAIFRQWRRYVAIGHEQIELNLASGREDHRLEGEFVVPRTIDTASPLTVRLKCTETRNWTELHSPSVTINTEQNYWNAECRTESLLRNPFAAETRIPFSIAIPNWLPRPWIKQTTHGKIGVSWNLQVRGQIDGVNFQSDFSLHELEETVPVTHRSKQRIVIPNRELAGLLNAHNIHWEIDQSNRTIAIGNRETSYRDKTITLSMLAVGVVACVIVLRVERTNLGAWHTLILFPPLLVALWIYQNLHRRVVFTSSEITTTWKWFGLTWQKRVPKENFEKVDLKWKIVGQEDSRTVWLEVSLGTMDEHSRGLSLVRLENRFLAKALAYAIGNELRLPVKIE